MPLVDDSELDEGHQGAKQIVEVVAAVAHPDEFGSHQLLVTASFLF